MRTVQMTLDDSLVREVDRIAKKLHINRSAFTRKALQEALARYKTEQLEQRHRQGYTQHPPDPDEFAVWATEQAWGDE